MMKRLKIIILCLIFCTSLAQVIAADNKMPEWSEFCPEKYLPPQFIADEKIPQLAKIKGKESTQKIKYCKSEPEWIKKAAYITVLPAAHCWSTEKISVYYAKKDLQIENEKNSYWQDRHADFQKGINICRQKPKKEQNQCFSDLRSRQYEISKNERLNLNDTELVKQLEIKDKKELEKTLNFNPKPPKI